MTALTDQQMLANDLIKRYPEVDYETNHINETFKVTFADLMFDCRCEFIKHPSRDYYRFVIESEEIFDDNDFSYRLYTEILNLDKNKNEDYYTQIMNMLEWNKGLLNNLVYDNRQGKLIDSRVTKTLTQIEEIDHLRINYMGNMVFNKMEECCVCYEKTNSKTDCDHSICYMCATKVKKDEGERNCPMCRERFTMS
jgi:hypothetical protein